MPICGMTFEFFVVNGCFNSTLKDSCSSIERYFVCVTVDAGVMSLWFRLCCACRCFWLWITFASGCLYFSLTSLSSTALEGGSLLRGVDGPESVWSLKEARDCINETWEPVRLC